MKLLYDLEGLGSWVVGGLGDDREKVGKGM